MSEPNPPPDPTKPTNPIPITNPKVIDAAQPEHPATSAPAVNPIVGVYNFACDAFKNNGKLRGILYVGIATLTVVQDHLKG